MSKSSRVNPEVRDDVVEVHEDIVEVNWSFLPMESSCLPVYIPRSQFNDDILRLRSLFVKELQDHLGFNAQPASIKIFKLLDETTIQETLVKGWTTEKEKVELVPAETLSDEISDIIDNRKLVHLLVDAKAAGISDEMLVIDNEDGDVFLPLIERYNMNVTMPGRSPSAAAYPNEYADVQSNPATAIYDGRMKRAPPLEIYHPIFAEFHRLVQDREQQPTAKDILNVEELFNFSAEPGPKELTRNEDMRRILTKILGCSVVLERNADATSPDGMYSIEIDDSRVPLLVVELKKELGDGACDPSTQAGLSLRRTWIQKNRQPIRNACCCPTFVLAGGGPWLTVMGGVFTDRVIVQRLTDMMWLVQSSSEEAGRVYNVARVFHALRLCLAKLEGYYDDVAETLKRTVEPVNHAYSGGSSGPIKATNGGRPTFSNPNRCASARFFPYPTVYIDQKTKGKVEFRYIRALEPDYDLCVTFLAKTTKEPKKKIVVKFGSRYGKAVHTLLAEQGHAPWLHYCGPLSVDSQSSESKDFPAGLFLGPLQMVVMDYVESDAKSLPSASDRKRQVENVVNIVHGAGFVFGDLRDQNILFDKDGRVQLIDFNWAGRERGVGHLEAEVATYPYNLSMSLDWHRGVKPMGAILREHDLFMLGNLYQ